MNRTSIQIYEAGDELWFSFNAVGGMDITFNDGETKSTFSMKPRDAMALVNALQVMLKDGE